MFRIEEPQLFEIKKNKYLCENLKEKDFYYRNDTSPLMESADYFINKHIFKSDNRSEMKINSGMIGLVSKFGSGKSFFLHYVFCRIIQKDLGLVPVYIDISRYENNYDRLLIIIFSEIAKSLSIVKDKRHRSIHQIAKELLPSVTKLGVKVFGKKITGLDEELFNVVGEISENLMSYLIESLDEEQEYLRKLASLSDKAPLVIMVDNLDRCRPEFVLDFFVLMKRFFRVDNILFIVAYDKQQIINLLKTLYGEEVDISSYMRKYVAFEFYLKQDYPIRDFTLGFLSEHHKKYSSEEFYRLINQETTVEIYMQIIDLLEKIYLNSKMSLRQYQHALLLVLNYCEHNEKICKDKNESTDVIKNPMALLMRIIVIYIKIMHPTQYQNIVNYIIWESHREYEIENIIEILFNNDSYFLADIDILIYNLVSFFQEEPYDKMEHSDFIENIIQKKNERSSDKEKNHTVLFAEVFNNHKESLESIIYTIEGIKNETI